MPAPHPLLKLNHGRMWEEELIVFLSQSPDFEKKKEKGGGEKTSTLALGLGMLGKDGGTIFKMERKNKYLMENSLPSYLWLLAVIFNSFSSRAWKRLNPGSSGQTFRPGNTTCQSYKSFQNPNKMHLMKLHCLKSQHCQLFAKMYDKQNTTGK